MTCRGLLDEIAFGAWALWEHEPTRTSFEHEAPNHAEARNVAQSSALCFD